MKNKKLKKKLKKLKRTKGPSAISSCSDPDMLIHSMWDSGAMVFQIFVVKNGYNVVTHYRKPNGSGGVTNSRVEVQHVNTLEEITKLMLTTGAVNALGVL